MAGGGFDRLWLSGGGAVAVAVLRGAEVGAALYHLRGMRISWPGSKLPSWVPLRESGGAQHDGSAEGPFAVYQSG